jgi:hypothetical protein
MILITAIVCVIAAVLVALFHLPRIGVPSGSAPLMADDAYCEAKLSNGEKYALSPEQAQNAALITRVAIDRGLPDHAATVALATTMQESRLTNLTYGDLDSVGLFQQRPSQGWGSVEQLMDETYAANAFYGQLLKVPDWQTIPVEDAAQEVQRSGYPDLYANWDGLARAWAAALTGEVAAGASCILEPAESSDVDGLTAALQGAFANISITRAEQQGDSSDSGAKNSGGSDAANGTATGLTLSLTVPADQSGQPNGRLCWQTTMWLVTHARQYGINAIHANGMDWSRKDGVWSGAEATESSITVSLA